MGSTYPSYNDFGKSTKDFFTKGFQTGTFKLNIRDQVTKHIGATITGTHKLENQQATGDFQAKCTCPVLPGFVSTTKWTTGNVISQEILLKDWKLSGLDFGVEGLYNVDTATMNGKLKSAFRHERVTVDGSVEGGESNVQVGGSIVTGHKDFAAGYQFQFDTAESILKKNNISLAYVKGPFSFHSSLDNAELLWAGAVFRFTPALELGATATYKSDPEGYSVFGAAVKYVMDCCTAIKAKVDTDKQIGLGFEVKIRPTATITMSAQIDGDKLNAGGHKVGLSFDLEA